jgi:thioredoxin reductase
VQVKALALRAEDRDEFDGAVDGTEPVRRQRRELVLELVDGSSVRARRVVLATGMDYRYPAVPGIETRWGRSVFHCPFCHGWEVRDRALGVLDRGAMGVHRALLLRVWSEDVTLFSNGPAELDDAEAALLAAAGVTVDERRVAELRGPGDEMETVAFDDGTERACGGLLVPVTMHQRSTLAQQLGARSAEPGPVAADAIDVDAMFQTSAAGVSAVGDVSSQMPSAASAIAAGSMAAAMIVRDIVAETHHLAT